LVLATINCTWLFYTTTKQYCIHIYDLS